MTRMDLKGKKALVVGLARSGEAAAELLLREGAHVTVNDLRPREKLGEAAARMQHAGARLVLGEHPASLFLKSDLIVVSPGVPRSLAPLQAARDAGVEIVSELELASRFLEVPVVAITGTNGKSTTTTFAGHFLRGSLRRVFVGGNLGTPLAKAVEGDHDAVVVEVSSFQLEWTPTFRPQVAVLLNVTEDHLDRYLDFDDYAETKGLLFAQQTAEDFAVVNHGDPLTYRLASKYAAPVYAFGFGTEVKRGIRYVDGRLEIGEEGRWESVSLAGFRPRGRHNIENLMAAFLAAHLSGIPVEKLASLVPHLEGLPHRLELTRQLDGISFFNDSKATNVASVQCSLRDFEEPLVLLMGGRDKGGSYAPLETIVREKVRSLIVFGEARPLIKEALGGLTRCIEVEDLAQAVLVARAEARPGDSVVLSPACSSYDQFPNYEVRGETFKRLVWQLGTVQGAGDIDR